MKLLAMLMLALATAQAHRLDEYLQGTLISIEKNRVEAQMTLTPGVSVFPALIAEIDVNGDGVISEIERRAYAMWVLSDISLSIDGHRLTPRIVSMEFPAIAEMKEGRGQIQITFDAELPFGGPDRKFKFENHHQSRIAAYQVNSLVPRDPGIQILAQNRNYTQSIYEMEFAADSARPTIAGSPLGVIALLLAGGVVLFWRISATQPYAAPISKASPHRTQPRP